MSSVNFFAEFLYEIADWVLFNVLLGFALGASIYRLKTIHNLKHDYVNDTQAMEIFDSCKTVEHATLPATVILLFFHEEIALALVFAPWVVAKFTAHALGLNEMVKGDMYKRGYLERYKTFAELGFFIYFIFIWVFFFRLWREIIDEVYHKTETRGNLNPNT